MGNSLFIKCFIGSLIFHTLLLTLFFFFPTYFQLQPCSISMRKKDSKIEPYLSVNEKELVLAEVFHRILIAPTLNQKSLDLPTKETLKPHFPQPSILLSENPFELNVLLKTPYLETPSLNESICDSHRFSFANGEVEKNPMSLENPFHKLLPNCSQPIIKENLGSSLKENDSPSQEIPPYYSPDLSGTPLQLQSSKKPLISNSQEIHADLDSQIFISIPNYCQLKASDYDRSPYCPNSPISAFNQYGIHLKPGLEWKDLFDVEMKIYPQEEGYLFGLTFLAKTPLLEHSLKQNYYFLIDGSQTIDRNRYQTFKRGVIRALSCLKEGDFFNILIFDSKIIRLNPTPLPFNKKNQQVAEHFLHQQDHTNFGKLGDIGSFLNTLLPIQSNYEEAHTAILISNGNSVLQREQQRQAVQTWIGQNHGKITLYTAAVGEDNNILFLELLSRLSRGHLMYSDTHASFPRKLAKLVSILRKPLVKEMALTIVATDPEAHLQLYPTDLRMPDLLSGKPYVVFGRIKKPTDFTIMLQGKNRENVLSIKKTLSFQHAKTGTSSFLREWYINHAHLYYEQYLQNGRSAFLEKAQSYLIANQELLNSKRK